MLRASDVNAELSLHDLPAIDGAEQTIALGIFSSLQPQNVRLRRAIAADQEASGHPRFALLFDPQTSGGLLAGVPAAAAAACVADLRAAGYRESAIIGTVVARGDCAELVTVRA